MSMPHLRLAVLEIGAGHAEPVVVRAPHHQPVHPGHLELAASRFDPPRQDIVIPQIGLPSFTD